MIRKLGPDRIYSQDYIKKQKNKKKFDKPYNPRYEKNWMERLVLYTLGKSATAISCSQIEKEGKKQNGNQRPNYVYEIIKKLSPDSIQFPHTLLFKYDDIIDKNNKIKEYSDENREKLNNKICSKVYDSYNLHFGWKNKSEVECFLIEKERNNEKFIELTVGNKNAKSVKIILKIGNNSDNDVAKLFYINLELPIMIKRQKGTIYIYSIKYDTAYHLRCYLDKLSIKPSKENDSVSLHHPNYKKDNNQKGEKNYYVLNLRGFLHYLLLTKKNKKSSYEEINKVIETLAENDYDWHLQNGIKSLSNNGDIPTEYQKSFNKDIFYKHRVTESFSFLSYYNQYKEFLPKNYAADTLIEVASALQNRLESIDISKLNYEVTSRFFLEIEQYFWEYPSFFFEHRIANRDEITDETFATLKSFQEKTRAYLRSIKENELKDHIQQTEYYNEQNFRNELKRIVLNLLEVTDKSVVSIKEILDSNNIKTDIDNPWGAQMSVIEEICESYRQDYVTSFGDFLTKKSKIEEIKKILKPKMTFEKVKELLCKNENYDEPVIIELIKLAGYRIKKDMKTRTYMIILTG